MVSRGGMAEHGTADAVTTAGRNTTSSTTPLVVQTPTSSLLIFAFINSATTLVCACLTAVCVLSGLGLAGYRRRKEHLLADRLGAASSTYWSFEHDVERLLRFTERLKSRVVLHGVTEFDLLAYKFRVENGVYEDDTGTPPHESFVTLKRLEHMFETLVIHLPTAGRRRLVWPWSRAGSASRRGGLTFGSAVCRVAVATAAVWCDDCVPTIRAVVRYFGGQDTAGEVDVGRQVDSALERRVLATVPYVRSLRLVDDHFLLTAPSSILNQELRDHVAAVDERLTADGGASVAVNHPTAVIDAYRSVREVCVDVGLVRRGDRELPERPLSSPANVVPLLRHLLRLACGTRSAARRTEPDERFRRLVAGLYDDLVVRVDVAAIRAAERSRDGSMAIANVLTTALLAADPHFTKATLEHIERELCRHVISLAIASPPSQTARPTVYTTAQQQVRAGALAVSSRPVVSFEESSGCPSGQYVTAVSLSSLEVEEPPPPRHQPSTSTSSFFQHVAPANGANDDNQFTETAI